MTSPINAPYVIVLRSPDGCNFTHLPNGAAGKRILFSRTDNDCKPSRLNSPNSILNKQLAGKILSSAELTSIDFDLHFNNLERCFFKLVEQSPQN
jgi:hypothetical protein